eukprot:jgi/Botrbrau1/14517/Bobra.0223s0007.1
MSTVETQGNVYHQRCGKLNVTLITLDAGRVTRVLRTKILHTACSGLHHSIFPMPTSFHQSNGRMGAVVGTDQQAILK